MLGCPNGKSISFMARLSSLLPAGEPSAAGDVTEDAADPAWPSTLDLDPDEVVTEVTRLNHQGMTHNWHRDFDTALLLGSRARDLAATHLGDRHFQYAVSVNTMATALEGLGDLAAARALFEEAVDVLRQSVGENDPFYGSCLNNLANVELAAGNLDFAEDLFQRALTIMRSEFGEQDPRLVPTINNLAHLHLERDDVVKAEELLRAGLEIRRGAFGEVNPEYARSLRHLGELLIRTARLAEAADLAERVLAIRTETLGDDHPDTIDSIEDLAQLQEALRFNTMTPRSPSGDCWSVLGRVAGEEHPMYVGAMADLADVCVRKGDYVEATKVLRQASDLHVTVFGEEDPGLTRLLRLYGQLYTLTGKYRQAEDVLRRALDIDERADSDDVDIDLTSMAELRRVVGDLTGAMSYVSRARALLETRPDVGTYRIAVAMNNHAELYRAMKKAARRPSRSTERLWSCSLKVRGEHHLEHAAVVNNLGLLHNERGDYRAAVPLLEQAVAIHRESLGPDHVTYAAALANLGAQFLLLGDHANAEELLGDMAIRRRVLGDGHIAVAEGFDHLGALQSAKGRLDLAEPLIRRGLETYRAVLGDGHPEVAKSIHNLAGQYLASGHPALAARFLAEMDPVLQAALAQDEPHPQWAHTLDMWAEAFAEVGNVVAAEPLVRQALDLLTAALGQGHPHLAHPLRRLSRICAATGRADEARSLMWQASAITDGVVEQVFATTSEAQRLAFTATIRDDIDLTLSLLTWHGTRVPTDVNASVDLVLRRKARSAEALAVQRDWILGGGDPDLVARMQELTALRSQIAQETLAGPGAEDLRRTPRSAGSFAPTPHRDRIGAGRAIPEMALNPRGQGADHRSVALALPAAHTLVEFIRFSWADLSSTSAPRDTSPRYLAFVMTRATPDTPAVVDLGNADEIDDLVGRFRDIVAIRPDQRANAESDGGVMLRRRVFDPLEPFLESGSHVILAPDGDLNRLSFEALPAADGQLVIDAYRLSYVGCGRDVLRHPLGVGEPGPPLVVADPAFNLAGSGPDDVENRPARQSRDLDRGTRFWRLRGTREEGERIAGLLGSRPLLGEEALEGRVRRVRSPHVLHIATHGYFIENRQPDEGTIEPTGRGPLAGPPPENPLLRSGLAFAGVNIWLRGGAVPPEAEDGLLTAEDITGMDLVNTDLVVLSACETGLGDVRTGEGVFGLRRAIILAGARSLVMSLWKVPDEQTGTLMVDFYRRVLAGRPVATALRDAQLELRKE